MTAPQRTPASPNVRHNLATIAAPPQLHPTPPPKLKVLAVAVARRAARSGLNAEFLGFDPLFTQPRLYGEGDAPWVVCPAAHDPMIAEGLPIPDCQRRQLKAYVDAGMDFPHIYLAHEVAKRSAHRVGKPVLEHHRALTDSEAKQLIVRPNAPATTRKTAHRLDTAARALGRGLRATGTATAVVTAGAVAIPLLMADGLDPAVLGAVTLPGANRTPTAPAAWFLLAHWDW
ncbi:hypothetical protein [Mycobacterium sp. ZZG]